MPNLFFNFGLDKCVQAIRLITLQNWKDHFIHSFGGSNMQLILNILTDEEILQEGWEDGQCEDVHLEPLHQQHVLLWPEDDGRGGVQHVPDVPLTQGPRPGDGATVLVKT